MTLCRQACQWLRIFKEESNLLEKLGRGLYHGKCPAHIMGKFPCICVEHKVPIYVTVYHTVAYIKHSPSMFFCDHLYRKLQQISIPIQIIKNVHQRIAARWMPNSILLASYGYIGVFGLVQCQCYTNLVVGLLGQLQNMRSCFQMCGMNHQLGSFKTQNSICGMGNSLFNCLYCPPFPPLPNVHIYNPNIPVFPSSPSHICNSQCSDGWSTVFWLQ